MCLGIPARVVSVVGTQAVIDLRGREVVADASAVSVSPGDYVLTYSGLIVQILSPEEAKETLQLLDQVERGASIPG